MNIINVMVTIGALVSLYIFAVHKFTKQIEQIEGKRLHGVLTSLTSDPIRGTVFGTITAALLQSSTATIVATQSLVDAGVLSFAASVPIVFGANLGSVITSQLIAFNFTYVAAYIMLLGLLVSRLHAFKTFSKPVFYFGLIFFALSLITLYVEPIRSNQTIISLVSHISSLPVAILFGLAITVLFQTSSVATGLSLVLVGSSVLNFHQGIGILLGAGIGSTSTAFIASLVMNKFAKRTAVAHFLYNLLAVIIFLPFSAVLLNFVQSAGGTAVQQVANAYTLFNLLSVVVFLIFLEPFTELVSRLVKS